MASAYYVTQKPGNKNKILGEENILPGHEIIYKSLIPTFGSLHVSGRLAKSRDTFINYLMPECSLAPKSYSLFPYLL